MAMTGTERRLWGCLQHMESYYVSYSLGRVLELLVAQSRPQVLTPVKQASRELATEDLTWLYLQCFAHSLPTRTPVGRWNTQDIRERIYTGPTHESKISIPRVE